MLADQKQRSILGLDKLRASEPASHASHAIHASHHVSHARQMLVLSIFSFLRLLAIWHEFSLSSLSFQYRFVICLHLFHLLLR